jgi:hypothetical protein
VGDKPKAGLLGTRLRMQPGPLVRSRSAGRSRRLAELVAHIARCSVNGSIALGMLGCYLIPCISPKGGDDDAGNVACMHHDGPRPCDVCRDAARSTPGLGFDVLHGSTFSLVDLSPMLSDSGIYARIKRMSQSPEADTFDLSRNGR